MKFSKLYLFLTTLVAFVACVDPYPVQILSAKSYLFVDGTVTNLPQQESLIIYRTDPQATFRSSEFSRIIIGDIRNKNLPVSGANVSVLVNQQEYIRLEESEPGVYAFPAGFTGNVGSSYQLLIEEADGSIYESNDEVMLPVSSIKNIYDSFNREGIRQPNFYGERISTNDVFIDFDDPADQQNFYTWRWIQYESQLYCASCKQGRYFLQETPQGITGDCVTDSRLNFNNFYDYFCVSSCWDIFYSNNINILSDIYTNGREQVGKLVAQVPVYQRNPALVVIEQRSLTPKAFRYLKLIEDQSVNTGTLVDTPPAPIKSNVVNRNNQAELVLGFFTASAVAEKRYMLTREGITSVLPNNLFIFQNAREPASEPINVVRPSVPNALCIPSRSRTPFTPAGWLLTAP